MFIFLRYGQKIQPSISDVNVVVQFYPWFKFYFTLLLGMVMYEMSLK